jgi:hypothetical protein
VRNLVSARDEQTKCVFGRASKPKSHWVYRAPELETNEEFGTEEMIVEVRGNRLCTVLPGSVHVSGEAIAFDDRHDNCPGSRRGTIQNARVLIEAIATEAKDEELDDSFYPSIHVRKI